MLWAMTASEQDETLTADDITGLNRQSVLRAAAFTRLAGATVLIAGVVAIVAWGWIVVRDQLRLDDFGDFDPVAADSIAVEEPMDASDPLVGFETAFDSAFDVTFADRVDVLLGRLGFALTAVMAVGIGLGLRLVADYSVARTGGSLTGYEVGDRV
jgi:hypothetical protein